MKNRPVAIKPPPPANVTSFSAAKQQATGEDFSNCNYLATTKASIANQKESED